MLYMNLLFKYSVFNLQKDTKALEMINKNEHKAFF